MKMICEIFYAGPVSATISQRAEHFNAWRKKIHEQFPEREGYSYLMPVTRSWVTIYFSELDYQI